MTSQKCKIFRGTGGRRLRSSVRLIQLSVPSKKQRKEMGRKTVCRNIMGNIRNENEDTGKRRRRRSEYREKDNVENGQSVGKFHRKKRHVIYDIYVSG